MHIPEEGLALRGTFVINPDGVIKTMEVHSNEIARDVSETLRKLKAAQFTAANPGQVCPRQVEGRRQDLTPFAGSGRQDLSRFMHRLSAPQPACSPKPDSAMVLCAMPSGFFCPDFGNQA